MQAETMSNDSLPPNAIGGEPIPKEFGYWKNASLPKNLRFKKVVQLLLRVNPIMDEERIIEFGRGYFDTDPVAEDVVDQMIIPMGVGPSMGIISQAIEQGIETVDNPPESMVTLFKQIEQDPDWLDMEKVDLGARLFRRHGSKLYHFLAAITLEGYRENCVAKPLAFTGAYSGGSAYKRFLETANFWYEISQPGGLLQGGKGRHTAVKVRLMHVLIRSRLMEHPEWDVEAWGKPISQSDCLLTLAAGSVGTALGMRQMGMVYGRKDIEAMLHFWRYVGHLLGVQPRWMPETYEESLQLSYTALVKGVAQSGDDGKMLSQSFLDAYAPDKDAPFFERTKGYLGQQAIIGLTRFYLGKEAYNVFELPKNGLWQWWPIASIPYHLSIDLVRKVIPPLDRWLDRRTQRKTREWLDERLGDRGAEYTVVETFTR